MSTAADFEAIARALLQVKPPANKQAFVALGRIRTAFEKASSGHGNATESVVGLRRALTRVEDALLETSLREAELRKRLNSILAEMT